MLTIITFGFNAIANFALGLGVAYYLGAQEFGAFALAVAAGAVMQTLVFEWIRLAANRFYGEKQGEADPGILATLNLCTGIASLGLSVIAIGLYFGGGAFGATPLVAAMAPLIAVSSGLFDFRCALARARFDNATYAAIILIKNAAALVLMLGGALYWCRADLVLIGLCVSTLASVVGTARAFRTAGGASALARGDLFRDFARYSVPLIVSSLIFQINMFMARSGVALQYGLAESGRFSLALDMGMKIVATLGSALDILLFQLAVRAEAEKGADAARAQLSRNITIIMGILLPAIAGYWLVLPSFEAFFASKSYQGAFVAYSTLLLPGLLAYGVVHYVVNPLFQIAKITAPVIVAALANFAVTAAVMFLMPGVNGGHGAIATSAGFLTGAMLMIVLAWRVAPVTIPWGDLARIGLAVLLMVLAALPLRVLPPGLVSLVAVAAAGGLTYLCAAVALNIGGLGARVMTRLRPAHS